MANILAGTSQKNGLPRFNAKVVRLTGTSLVTPKFAHFVYAETKELIIHVVDIANVIAGKSKLKWQKIKNH